MDAEHQTRLTDAPDRADVAVIGRELAAFDRRLVGDDGHWPLTLLLRDPNGDLAGLGGDAKRDLLRVDVLRGREDLRGQGHGGRLLAAAEAEAARRGCARAHLDTVSFQAPNFYRTRGCSRLRRARRLRRGADAVLMEADSRASCAQPRPSQWSTRSLSTTDRRRGPRPSPHGRLRACASDRAAGSGPIPRSSVRATRSRPPTPCSQPRSAPGGFRNWQQTASSDERRCYRTAVGLGRGRVRASASTSSAAYPGPSRRWPRCRPGRGVDPRPARRVRDRPLSAVDRGEDRGSVG